MLAVKNVYTIIKQALNLRSAFLKQKAFLRTHTSKKSLFKH